MFSRMTYLDLGSWSIRGARYKIILIEWGLSLTRKRLVTPMMFVPLLHQWACLARPNQSLLPFIGFIAEYD